MKANNITFNSNGVKIDGKHIHGSYDINNRDNYYGLPKNTIIIYLDTYFNIELPGLHGENESDMMTDYFEKTKLVITPKNRYYKEAKAACTKNMISKTKKLIKHKRAMAEKYPKNSVMYLNDAIVLEKQLDKLMKK